MVYCPNCGNPNEDAAQFCIQCGHSLAERPDSVEPARAPSGGRVGVGRMLLIAVLALVIVAPTFVAFLLERFPPAVVAVAGAAAFLALGYIDTRDMLAQAGFPDGGFKLTLHQAAENVSEGRIAPLIQSEFKKLGIEVEVKGITWTQQWAQAKGDPKEAQDIFLLAP